MLYEIFHLAEIWGKKQGNRPILKHSLLPNETQNKVIQEKMKELFLNKRGEDTREGEKKDKR